MANKVESEEKLQARCFQWFWNKYPELRRTMFAVPNGGARNITEASRMKATGTVAGVSDLVWVYKGRTIFIEMKNEIGTQSDAQREFEKAITGQLCQYKIIRTFGEFTHFIELKMQIIG